MEIHELLTSKDITAGSFIDRVGVALGLPFPCGKWLEALAEQGNDTYRIPRSSVKGAFSFSGPETRVQRDIASDAYRKEDIAKGVLIHIGRALEKELSGYPSKRAVPSCSWRGHGKPLSSGKGRRDLPSYRSHAALCRSTL